MPNDEIHAKFRSQGNADQAMENIMPNDAIHAHLGTDMSNMQGMMMPGMEVSANSPLKWDSPKEWQEKKGSGMRLATFVNTDQSAPMETTIVSLGGAAGGLEANINRWLQQLKMPVLSEKKMNDFINAGQKIETKSGPAKLFDFTLLQKKSPPETPSMVAVIIDSADKRIFVKMTGSKAAVLKNFDPFKSLAQSIHMDASP